MIIRGVQAASAIAAMDRPIPRLVSPNGFLSLGIGVKNVPMGDYFRLLINSEILEAVDKTLRITSTRPSKGLRGRMYTIDMTTASADSAVAKRWMVDLMLLAGN